KRRVHREYALNAFAVGDLANGEALVDAAAGTGNYNAFVSLYAGTATFRNAYVDANGVTWGELRQGALGSNLGGLFGFQLFDNVSHINLLFLLKQPERPTYSSWSQP